MRVFKEEHVMQISSLRSVSFCDRQGLFAHLYLAVIMAALCQYGPSHRSAAQDKNFAVGGLPTEPLVATAGLPASSQMDSKATDQASSSSGRTLRDRIRIPSFKTVKPGKTTLTEALLQAGGKIASVVTSFAGNGVNHSLATAAECFARPWCKTR